MPKFHLNDHNHIAPCTATLRDCPFVARNHFDSLEAATQASLSAIEEGRQIARLAPYDLRGFFSDDGFFNARLAAARLAETELGREGLRLLRRDEEFDFIVEALAVIAHPSFDPDDERWHKNIFRNMLKGCLPKTFARLEEQAVGTMLARMFEEA